MDRHNFGARLEMFWTWCQIVVPFPPTTSSPSPQVALSSLDRHNFDEELSIRGQAEAKLILLKLTLDQLPSVHRQTRLEEGRRGTLLRETKVYGREPGTKGTKTRHGIQFDYKVREGSGGRQMRGTNYNTTLQIDGEYAGLRFLDDEFEYQLVEEVGCLTINLSTNLWKR